MMNTLPWIAVSAFLNECPDEPLPRQSHENNPLEMIKWAAVTCENHTKCTEQKTNKSLKKTHEN